MKANQFKELPSVDYMKLGFNKALTPLLNTGETCLGILHDLLLIHLVPKYVKTVYFNDNLLMLMQFVPYK